MTDHTKNCDCADCEKSKMTNHKTADEILMALLDYDKTTPILPNNPTQKAMIELAIKDIKAKKNRRYKLEYQKHEKTIIAIDEINRAKSALLALLLEAMPTYRRTLGAVEENDTWRLGFNRAVDEMTEIINKVFEVKK